MSAPNINPRPPRLEPGRVIDGRYTIEGPLGEGGYASVYRARHVKLGNEVALKVLSLRPKNDEEANTFEERFLREAQIGARIRHRDVVTVHDFGVMPDTMQPYIAMELLEGHDLGEELERKGPLQPARCIRLFLGVLDAIQKGHEQGVVHKDLKPSNLFLSEADTERERLIVLDYGIARLYEDPDSRLTRTGGVSGTPLYLAPEYIANQTAVPQTDVYQLGLILVEALTGIPPAQADNPLGCIANHAMGKLTIPGTIRDSPLAPIVNRALAKEYQGRFDNAGALRAALQELDLAQLSSLKSDIHPVLETAIGVERVFGNAETGGFDDSSLSAIQKAATQALPAEHRKELRAQGAPAESDPSNATETSSGGESPSMAPHPLQTRQTRGYAPLWWGLGALFLLGGLTFLWFLAGTSADEGDQKPEPQLAESGGPSTESKLEETPEDQRTTPSGDDEITAISGVTDNPQSDDEPGTGHSKADAQTPVEQQTTDQATAEGEGTEDQTEENTGPENLAITSSPKRVSVFHNGELLGRTPLQVAWSRLDIPVTLTFKRRGYHSRDKIVEVELETLEVALERKRRRPDQRGENNRDREERDREEREARDGDDKTNDSEDKQPGDDDGNTESDPVMVAP